MRWPIFEAMRGRFRRGASSTCRRAGRRSTSSAGGFDAALVSLASGPVELIAGDAVAAESELRRDYETLAAMGERNYISTTAAFLAEALLRLGRDTKHRNWPASPRRSRPAMTCSPSSCGAARVARCSPERDGSWKGRRWLARRSGSPIPRHPTAQGNALIDLAEVLGASGQATEARAAVEAAIARFQAKGNTASAASARRQLEALRDPAGATVAADD